ncbi:MAG TPA: hypothetical protein VFR09_03645 [Alphaproteobacteria bacterium]|nr:hypothetical protein [Alphaproteobacteria bacterium]
MRFLPLLLLLSACAAAEPVYKPVAVDMPVLVACQAKMPAMPQDLMSALPKTATLTEFTRACAEQALIDKSALLEFQSALQSCE